MHNYAVKIHFSKCKVESTIVINEISVDLQFNRKSNNYNAIKLTYQQDKSIYNSFQSDFESLEN